MDGRERWLASYAKIIPSLKPIVRKATLTRTETSNEGTFGTLVTDSGFSIYSGELPWRSNTSNISCIPAGIYIVQRIVSPKHGPCYCLTDVPGRTDVEVHRGNWCGDVDLGFKSDVKGCIITGRALGSLAGQASVLSSGDALKGLEADLECLPFQLEIVWSPNLGNPEA